MVTDGPGLAQCSKTLGHPTLSKAECLCVPAVGWLEREHFSDQWMEELKVQIHGGKGQNLVISNNNFLALLQTLAFSMYEERLLVERKEAQGWKGEHRKSVESVV